MGTHIGLLIQPESMRSIIKPLSESRGAVEVNGECFVFHARHKPTLPASSKFTLIALRLYDELVNSLRVFGNWLITVLSDDKAITNLGAKFINCYRSIHCQNHTWLQDCCISRDQLWGLQKTETCCTAATERIRVPCTLNNFCVSCVNAFSRNTGA